MIETRNRLIGTLEPSERRRWEPYFQRECLHLRQELFGPDDPLDSLWFPEGGVCSQVVESGEGRSVEVAVVGREGVAGLPAIFGARHAATRVIVQAESTALRIRVRSRTTFSGYCWARRPSVTEVAQHLQQLGLIAYERGIIRYVDIAGLEAAACECYGIIRRLESSLVH